MVEQNPIESADIDNCITLCKKHHKQVHKLSDCGYHDLKCANINSENDIYNFIRSIYKGIVNYGPTLVPDRDLIVLPSIKLAIKYCLLTTNSELSGKNSKYHLATLQLCGDLGYRLITIFEDEWVMNNTKCKSRLASYVNSSHMRRIFARKCVINEISHLEAKSFCEANHIQNYGSGSSIKLGAFFNDELVSVMTFSKPSLAKGRKKTGTNEYELHRFCSKLNTIVVGSASKLLKYFERNYTCDKLFTFADKRWSGAGLYYELGFTRDKDSAPCYFYFNNEKIRRHRFLYRKNVLKDKLPNFYPEKTEVANMYANGFDRIWDCGNFKLYKTYI